MAQFTPEEIQQILEAFFETMGTRQYIGARYVPIFGRKDEESIQWDDTKPYEPLTVVLYQGNSFTSRQYVPAGVSITNMAFWANTGNYNAQVEQYRQEVATFQEGLDAQADRTTALEGALPSTEFSSTNTVKAYVDGKVADIADVLPSTEFSSTDTVKDYIDSIATNPDFIADNAVTAEKIGYLKGKKVIVYGDSTFVDRSADSEALGAMVAEVSGATVDNRAVGGTSLSSLIQLLTNASSTDFEGADYCLFAYGTNDWQGNTPISGVNGAGSFEMMLDTAYSLFKALTSTCIGVFVTPACGKRSFTSENKTFSQYNLTGATLEDYVDATLSFCHRNKVPAIDLYHLCGIPDSMAEAFCYPSAGQIYIHYNDALKRKIAELITTTYPYEVPTNPYYGSTGALHNPFQTISVNIPSESEMTALDSTAFKYPSAPAFWVNASNPSRGYSAKLSGDNTLVFGHKASSRGVVISVNGNELCIVQTQCIAAVRIKGIYDNNAYITFTSPQDVKQWICAPQLYNGHLPVSNSMGAQDMVIKKIPTGWLPSTRTITNALVGIGISMAFIQFDITLDENIAMGSRVSFMPVGTFGYNNMIMNGWVFRGSAYEPMPFTTSRNTNNTWNLIAGKALSAGDRIFLTAVIPTTVGVAPSATW